MQTPEHLFLTKKQTKKSNNIKNNNTHTASASGGAGGCTDPLPEAARAARIPARPQFAPGSWVAPLHASGTGSGLLERKEPPDPPSLGVWAFWPRSLATKSPEGTAKSTLATAKREPKAWGPAPRWPPGPPPTGRSFGNKGPLPPESSLCARAAVRGGEAASAERGWDRAAGAAGLRRLRTRGCSLRPCHRAVGPRGGAGAVGAACIMVSRLPGPPATQGLRRGNPALPFGCLCGLLSSFRTRKTTAGIRGTGWQCFHERPPCAPGGLSRTPITRPTHRQPPSSVCSCGGPRRTRWVHLEPLRPGARRLPEKRPGAEASPGWILRAKQTASQ